MAKRLNKKFLYTTGGVLGGIILVGALVVGIYYMRRPGADVYADKGDAAMKAGDYETAVKAYGDAVARRQGDPALLTKFLEATEMTVNGDSDKMEGVYRIEGNLLAADPRSVPTLERMLKSQEDRAANAGGDALLMQGVGEMADRILTIDPQNVPARISAAQVLLQKWRREERVEPEEIDKQMASLRDLLAKHPEQSKALYTLALYDAQKAYRARVDQKSADATAAIADARKLVDSAAAGLPKDAGIAFVKAQIYQQLAALSEDKDAATELRKAVPELIQQSYDLADPKSEQYALIRQAALQIMQQDDPKAAEAAYQAALKKDPSSIILRIALARFLAGQPGRLDEAVTLLSKPAPDGPRLGAMESLQRTQTQFIERVMLAQYKLQALATVADKTERDKQIAQVQTLYDGIQQTVKDRKYIVDSPIVLRVRAGLELARNDVGQAIETLDAAIKQTPPIGQGGNDQQRLDLLTDYANAQLILGNTGAARGPLKEILAAQPGNVRARLTLVNTLLRERKFDEAQPHIDLLTKAFPDVPEIQRLKVVAQLGDADKMAATYAKMPEGEIKELREKLSLAATLKKQDEMVRLGRLLLVKDPGDTQAALLTGQVLLNQGKKDEAIKVLQQAAKDKPDSSRQLDGIVAQLQAGSADALNKVRADQIAEIQDPLTRELALGDLARQQGDGAGARAHYEKALSISSGDSRAPDALLHLAIGDQKWDQADKYVAVLAKLNADQTNGATARTRLQLAKAVADPDPASRQRKLDVAVDLARSLTSQYDQIAQTWLIYGQALQARQKYEQALEQYLIAMDKQPTNLDAIRGAVDILGQLGRNAEAKKYIDQALGFAPQNPYFLELQTNWELAFGDPERAVARRKEAADRNPDDLSLVQRLGATYLAVARTKAAAGDETAARDYLQKASDVFRGAMGQWPDDLQTVAYLAEAQRALGHPEVGESSLQRLVNSPAWKGKPQAAMLLADNLARSNKLPEAEQVLREYLGTDKSLPTPVLLQLSRILVMQKRLPDALAVLEQSKDDPELKRQRVELLIAAGQIDAARAAVEERLANAPTPEIYTLAAFIELRSGNLDKAEGFINRALKTRPNDAGALFYRAQIRLQRRPPQIDDALADLTAVRDLQPSNIEARVALADVLLLAQRQDQAVRELETAWKISTDNKQLLLKLVDAYASTTPPRWGDVERVINQARGLPQFANDPDLFLTEAAMWASRKAPDRAVKLAKQGLALAPDNEALQLRYFDVLSRAGLNRQLVDETQPLVDKKPDAVQLRMMRGIALARTDQRDKAIEEYDAALKPALAAGNSALSTQIIRTIASTLGARPALDRLAPRLDSDNNARLLASELQLQQGNPQESLKLADRVLADGAKLSVEQRLGAERLIGSVALLVTPQQTAKARDAYLDILKVTPDDYMTLNNLAYVYTLDGEAKDFGKAVDAAKSAYQLMTQQNLSDPNILDTYGWALVLAGRAEEGLAILQNAMSAAGEQNGFPELYYHLGVAMTQNNNATEAERVLQNGQSLLQRWERQKRPSDPTLPVRFETALRNAREAQQK